MQKYFTLLLAIVATSISTFAQYQVKGCVTDSTGVSEPYATVRIYNHDNKEKPIKLGVTDINGKFSQELNSAGKYSLQISSVGKQSINEDFELSSTNRIKDFGTLIIKSDDNTLAGIEVVAQKPLVQTEIDRISYDIQADEDSKTSNIFDMLKKVPMITIDGEDKIKVNGSSDFKIYKNGRPNTSWSNNAKDVLKSIPASMIKRIEVITEPGAKYDAEGVAGILNIVTNDNSVINGVMGNVSTIVSTNKNHGANAYLTTQFGKVATSVNYGFNSLGKSNTVPFLDSEYTYVESGNRLTNFSKNDISGAIHYGNIEMSYDIDTLNLVTLSFGGYLFDVKQNETSTLTMYDKNNNQLYFYKNNTVTPQMRYFDFNGKLDYQHLTHNKGEALTFSYLLSTTNQDNDRESYYEDMVNFPFDYNWQTSDSKLHFYEHTFQFDWTRPFAEKHKLETGVKYILRQNHSKTFLEYSNADYNANTDFEHVTNIGAVYGEYSFNSQKWGARAGLRYEFAHLEGEHKNSDEPSFSSNIGDLVPTFSGSYKIDDANTLKLNFATRINRPGITYLNPARNITPTLISQGNPDLESTRRNSVHFTYSLIKPKIVFNTSVGYNWANNALATLTYMEDGILFSTYANNGKQRNYSFSLYCQWTPSKTTQLSLNNNVFHNKYTNTQNLENSGWGKNIFVNFKQNLPWKLVFNANYGYWSGSIYDTYSKGSDFSFHGASLSRSFLKDDRLTINISTRNPFSGKYQSGTSHTTKGERIGSDTFYRVGRSFSISASFRFGSLNAQVKKVNKSISNDDLEGRK